MEPTWEQLQTALDALAYSANLGDLLMVTGRNDATRSYIYEAGTIALSRGSNQQRVKRLRATGALSLEATASR
jgi:hypothetical protein